MRGTAATVAPKVEFSAVVYHDGSEPRRSAVPAAHPLKRCGQRLCVCMQYRLAVLYCHSQSH